MSDPFAPDPREPLALFARPLPDREGVRVRELEFSSRGDRVPAILHLPPGAGPHPLVLLGHGLGGSQHAAYLNARLGWAREGTAVLSIDFPLHGARRSAKLTERLVDRLAGSAAGTLRAPLDRTSQLLWREFARQAVLDLRRALDVAGELPEIDVRRVAYGGVSLGGLVGAIFCAVDERPRAAALALAGAGFGPPELDAAGFVGRIAPRPLLLVNVHGDPGMPDAAAEALHRAAGDPHRIAWFEGHDGELPAEAIEAVGTFLQAQLKSA